MQKPHPPVLLGNNGPNNLKRAVRYADEWMPIVARQRTPLAESIATLNRLAEEQGREVLPVSAFGATPNEEAIEELAAAGVHRCIFSLPPAPAAEVLPLPDRGARTASDEASRAAPQAMHSVNGKRRVARWRGVAASTQSGRGR